MKRREIPSNKTRCVRTRSNLVAWASIYSRSYLLTNGSWSTLEQPFGAPIQIAFFSDLLKVHCASIILFFAFCTRVYGGRIRTTLFFSLLQLKFKPNDISFLILTQSTIESWDTALGTETAVQWLRFYRASSSVLSHLQLHIWIVSLVACPAQNNVLFDVVGLPLWQSVGVDAYCSRVVNQAC